MCLFLFGPRRAPTSWPQETDLTGISSQFVTAESLTCVCDSLMGANIGANSFSDPIGREHVSKPNQGALCASARAVCCGNHLSLNVYTKIIHYRSYLIHACPPTCRLLFPLLAPLSLRAHFVTLKVYLRETRSKRTWIRCILDSTIFSKKSKRYAPRSEPALIYRTIPCRTCPHSLRVP
jgi:hypothetical protein